MNSSSSSSIAPILVDYHKKSANLRTKLLKNEEERIILDQKLRSLSNVDTRLKQRQQTESIQTYLTKLNQESQHALQRNTQLLNDISQAEINLNQLHNNIEQLIRLKHDYIKYLESNLQKSHDDYSLSDSNTFSHSKHSNSLRMELTRTGLYFLLNYIEQELIDTIDKKKFYHHDPPTITQKRTILDIANKQQQYAIKDLEPTTTSMVIIDQLSSTIRRTTIHKCLLTEDILSLNVIDLNKDIITNMLPEQDQSLWIRLIDHFIQLLKYHIMNSDILANKFAPTLLPNNVLYLHDKAKSVLKHILEKLLSTKQLNSDDETSTIDKKTNLISSSSWLNKLTSSGKINDNDESSTSSSITTTATKKNIHQDDSDLEFFG